MSGHSANRSPILTVDRLVLDANEQLDPHTHKDPTLFWAATAAMAVRSGSREWLVPPGYGLWMPALIEHGGGALQAGEFVGITFPAADCEINWCTPTGVVISPLLRELLILLNTAAIDDPTRPLSAALVSALLKPLPENTVQLTMPVDPRIRPIAEELLAHPGNQYDLQLWASKVHAGVRTLSRLFSKETGLSFSQWRTQARVRAAAGLLADGATVDAAARAVGYQKTSAFIAAFRRVTGQTPGMYGAGN